MADDATATPLGMVFDMENLRTESTASTAAPTRRRIRAGLAGSATVPTASTPVRSSPRNADDQGKAAKNLARIAKERRNGFMVSMADVEFLLEMIARSE